MGSGRGSEAAGGEPTGFGGDGLRGSGCSQRPLWVSIVLAAIAVVLAVLALIGLPLVPIGDHHVGQEFATFGAQFARWRTHSGWRYTSDSWTYWAGVTACVLGCVVRWLRVTSFTRKYALVGIPTAAVLALGPIAQNAVGLKFSDYESTVTFGHNLALSAGTIAVLLIVFYFAELLRRYLRSTSRGRSPLLPGE